MIHHGAMLSSGQEVAGYANPVTGFLLVDRHVIHLSPVASESRMGYVWKTIFRKGRK